jgi:hypothetical protein
MLLPDPHPGPDRDTPPYRENHHHPNGSSADPDTGDEWLEYQVVTDHDPSGEPVWEGRHRRVATLIADHLPGATIRARTITAGPWVTLPPSRDPNSGD